MYKNYLQYLNPIKIHTHNMTYHEKRISNNQIILKIHDDEILNSVFRSLNNNQKDLYKYVQIVRKSLLTFNDDEIFKVIKNFWVSIIKVSKVPMNDLQKEFSITKKTSLKIIFSTWLEILEYSQTHNNKYSILDEEYFDKVAEFFCSPNEKTIHTLAAYIQPNKKSIKRYSSLDFWKTGPKSKKDDNFKRISYFSSSDKVYRINNLIKFGLRCKKIDSEFVLNDLKLPGDRVTNFETYHYEFQDSKPRAELAVIDRNLIACFFFKGFYEYSKSKKYFDFNECLMVTWSKFKPGYRWTPWGFEDDKIGFVQIKKEEKANIPSEEHVWNVDLKNYRYSHELKDLELIIFSFHRENQKKISNTNLGLPFKYQSQNI